MTARCKCWTCTFKGSVMGLGRVLHWGPLVAIGEPSNSSIEALFWGICQSHHTICLILGIIKWVSLATIYCGTMWWPPAESIGGLLFLSSFLFFAGGLNNEPQQTRKEREINNKKYHTTMASKLYFLGMTMYHFLSAMVDGPGYLTLGWKPKEVLMLYQTILFSE